MVKGYHSRHQRLFIKDWGVGNGDSKVHRGEKQIFLCALFCPLDCRVLPLVALEKTASGKHIYRFHFVVIREGWGLAGAWTARVSGSPFSDEKLRTRAVVLN